MIDLKILSYKKLREMLEKKEIKCQELVEDIFERIEKEDKKIKSFLTLTFELAFEKAKKIDEMIFQKRKLKSLAGFPLAVKDNILIENVKCTAGSKILENYIAPFDATCIKKLKDEDVLIIGKTNLDEFAMGSSTENSAFFPTRNPHDLERVPGGSSGGSAAAVAAGFVLGALGSDTGGSIRQPAAFCGVCGLKPTYGAVSRYGLIAFASSLDQIGPIAKNVEDCELIFEVICGKDEMDSTSFFEKKIFQKKEKLKIGIPKEYFGEGLDKRIKDKIFDVLKKIEQEKFEVLEISLPHTEYCLACYFLVSRCEAASNLARYDGIRYSKLKEDSKDIFDFYTKIRGRGFGKEVKRRIMLGNFALSEGYYEGYYLLAQKVRTLISNDFKKAFEKVDLIFTPTTPTLPFKIGEKIKDPLSMYLADIFTVSPNLAGLPALSLPCTKIDNLPVGLQIIGPHFSEYLIFETAKKIEKMF